MDGVLVDSADAWFATFSEAFAQRLGRSLSREFFDREIWAGNVGELLRRFGLGMEVSPFCDLHFSRHLDSVKPFPGTARALSALAAFPKAVITNTPGACTRDILGRLDLARFFDHVVNGDDVSQGKPHPEPVLAGCRALGIEPADAVLVGDTETDVAAGRAAGCQVIGVGIPADFTVASVADLPGLFRLGECPRPGQAGPSAGRGCSISISKSP